MVHNVVLSHILLHHVYNPDLVSFPFYTIPLCNLKNFSFTVVVVASWVDQGCVGAWSRIMEACQQAQMKLMMTLAGDAHKLTAYVLHMRSRAQAEVREWWYNQE